jgi:hypothetical protein
MYSNLKTSEKSLLAAPKTQSKPISRRFFTTEVIGELAPEKEAISTMTSKTNSIIGFSNLKTNRTSLFDSCKLKTRMPEVHSALFQ